MKKSPHFSKVLLVQSLGFLAIITLSCVNEFIDLPSLIFANEPFVSYFRKSTLEILLVLAVWLLVTGSTRRVLRRVRDLEAFLKVCSWCRRIDYKGRWISLEEFMEKGFETPTTHGICQECLTKQKEAYARSKRAMRQETPPADEAI